MSYELRLLGPMQLLLDGSRVAVGGPKPRAVLARLAVARGAMVTSDVLVDALWPRERPVEPLASLQSFVSRLRGALQSDASPGPRDSVLRSYGNGYALHLPTDAIDAWLFETSVAEGLSTVERDPETAQAVLGRALDLWRGPALSDFADEPWAVAPAARLDEMRLVAHEGLLAARLGLGDAAVLVPDLEALVNEAPLREDRWRLLAIALYRSHRQAEALAAIRRARELLSAELGVDPGPGLRELERKLFAHSPDLLPPEASPRAAPDEVPSAPPRAAHVASRSVGDDPLVERADEMARLETCLDDAASGAGSVALVEGPAGIGKSRLLAELRRAAGERGMLVLQGRASQLELEFSFGVARQLFEPLLTRSDASADDLLAGAAASARPVFDLAGPAPGSDDSLFAVLHGLYWLTVNVAAQRSVVLLVDDLHWCDAGSLRFVSYLARRLHGLPVALVLTHRAGEQHALSALVDELRDDLATVQVRPVPLSRAGVSGLIARRLREDPADEFVGACLDGTNGNPLLLRQLLRGLENEAVRPDRAHADTARALGSRAISSMVLSRLRRLPAEATRVARALAVLGDGADLPLVAELSGLPESVVAEVTAALTSAEIVRAEPHLAFVHPLVREAVYRDATPAERELAHEAAARLLRRSHRSAEQVAAQLLLAPRRGDQDVVETLRHAAREAAGRASPDVAVSLLRRAMAEPPSAETRPSVLLELGLYETSTDGRAAGQDLTDAYDLLRDDDDRAAAALALTRTLVFVGDFGSPVRFATRALQTLPERLVDERAAILAYQRIAAQMHSVDPSGWSSGDEVVVPGDGPGSRMLQSALSFERMIHAAPRGEAVVLAATSLADGQLMTADPGLLWVWSQVVLDLADEDVMPGWDAINASVHQRGSLFGVLAVRFWRAWSLMRRGALGEAEDTIRTGLQQLDIWQSNATTMPYGQATLARVLHDQGRADEALAAIGDPTRALTAIDGDRLLWEVRADILLAAGRPHEALLLLDQVVDRVPHVVNPAWRRDRLLRCLAAARCGDRAHAVADAEALLALAERWGALGSVAEALLVLGSIRGRNGVDELRRAVDLLGPNGRPVLYGDALVALGSALGSPADAVEPLWEAHRVGLTTGAGRVVADATRVLRRLGLPLPVSDEPARPAVTETEQRVLAMVANGLDVNEIGQELLMTPAAVERHLAAARHRVARPG